MKEEVCAEIKLTEENLFLEIQRIYDSIPGTDLRRGMGNNFYNLLSAVLVRSKIIHTHEEPEYCYISERNKQLSNDQHFLCIDIVETMMILIESYREYFKAKEEYAKINKDVNSTLNGIKKILATQHYLESRLKDDLLAHKIKSEKLRSDAAKRLKNVFKKPKQLTVALDGVLTKYIGKSPYKMIVEIYEVFFPNIMITEGTIEGQLRDSTKK